MDDSSNEETALDTEHQQGNIAQVMQYNDY